MQATDFRYHWLDQWSFMFLANTLAPPAPPTLLGGKAAEQSGGGGG
ncbi:hypothetical protein SH449x_003551 [Pirellulaceae bacterium SH449]